VLICRVCATKTHKKHDIIDIRDSVKQLESKIPKYLNSKVDDYRSNTKNIDDRVEGYKAEVEETVKTILEQGKDIKELVESSL
jgi:peptidoglycan hydrolase CwlO-like protein